MNKETKLTIILISSVVPAGVAGLGYAGWMEVEVNIFVALAMVIIGGAVAGVMHGNNSLEKALYPIPFIIGGVVFMFGTTFYLSFRTVIMDIELAIPGAVGFMAFLLSYALINKILQAKIKDNSERVNF
ncbi:MAG: hypothetical protein J0M03_05565 [Acidobacteria bacterium]|nr:hypothetical protein [Acidobacteriota bacterium]